MDAATTAKTSVLGIAQPVEGEPCVPFEIHLQLQSTDQSTVQPTVQPTTQPKSKPRLQLNEDEKKAARMANKGAKKAKKQERMRKAVQQLPGRQPRPESSEVIEVMLEIKPQLPIKLTDEEADTFQVNWMAVKEYIYHPLKSKIDDEQDKLTKARGQNREIHINKIKALYTEIMRSMDPFIANEDAKKAVEITALTCTLLDNKTCWEYILPYVCSNPDLRQTVTQGHDDIEVKINDPDELNKIADMFGLPNNTEQDKKCLRAYQCFLFLARDLFDVHDVFCVENNDKLVDLIESVTFTDFITGSPMPVLDVLKEYINTFTEIIKRNLHLLLLIKSRTFTFNLSIDEKFANYFQELTERFDDCDSFDEVCQGESFEDEAQRKGKFKSDEKSTNPWLDDSYDW